MQEQPSDNESPNWGSSTKLVVGLTIVAFIGALLIYFRGIIGPLILAFILAFLLHPLVSRISEQTKLTWKVTVNLIYLVLVIILATLSTIAGFAIVQQIQSLINLVTRFVNDLPTLLEDLSSQIYSIGPFVIDFSQFDLTALGEQLLNSIQPLLGQAGGLIGQVAGGAASTLGWLLFVLLVSYFLLSESERFPGTMVNIDIPGYTQDIRKLGSELAMIWNSFLRGQLVISLLVIISYYLLLTFLGLRFSLAVALLAGLARFVPYLGPLTTWSITAIVAFFQPSNYLGLESLQYTLLVIILCVTLDQIFDNLIVPRFMGHALGVHPAGVLIAAIIVTNLIGIIGLVLAAPLLATLNLLGRYIIRKMFDQDPWPPLPPEDKTTSRLPILPWIRFGQKIYLWIQEKIQKFNR